MESGRIPLQFWLGPFLLLSLHLSVAVENFLPEQDGAVAPAPDLAAVPRGMRGLHRRSQPLGHDQQPAGIPGWIAYVLARYDRRLADLNQTFDDYIKHFSRKARIRIKGEVRRFGEAAGGAINWRVYHTADDIKEFYRLAREISRHTYQEKLFDKGIPDSPAFQEHLVRLANADQVRGYILFWGDVPISYIYCPADGDRLMLGFLGFRPEFARRSPGTVLQFLALESLFAEQRFRLFDFGEGGEGLHKRAFATHSVACANVLYLRRTLSNVALIITHREWSRLAETIVGLVERAGIKQRMRQWLRGQRSTDASLQSQSAG